MGRVVDKIRLLKPRNLEGIPPQEVMIEAKQRPLGPPAVQEGSSLSGGPLRMGTLKGRALVLEL